MSARGLVIDPVRRLGAFLLPVGIAFVLSGDLTVDRAAYYGLLAGLLSVCYSLVRWLTFRYAVHADRLDINSGVLSRRSRSIPLDRIRGVDLAASPLHRLMRLVVIRVDAAAGGTGHEDEAVLDAVTVREGSRLRRQLLARQRASDGDQRDRTGAESTAGEVLARVRPSWFMFSPLTGAYLFAPLALVGTLWGWLGTESFDERQVTGVAELVVADPWVVAVSLAAILVVGTPLASIGMAALLNWDFTVRGSEEALTLDRGLLTRRHVTLERRRVRGLELTEALPARPTRTGRLRALVTGLGGFAESRAELLPVAPVATIGRLAALSVTALPQPLLGHPRAARRRRLVRAVAPWLLPGAVAALAGVYGLAMPCLVLAVVGVPLALDRYRSLGHGFDGRYVCVRSGSWSRRTVVLHRRAVVGWQVRQTFFQRRQGLATLVVGVGAGSGEYRAIDMDARATGGLAHQVTPGWVGPFLPGR